MESMRCYASIRGLHGPRFSDPGPARSMEEDSARPGKNEKNIGPSPARLVEEKFSGSTWPDVIAKNTARPRKKS